MKIGFVEFLHSLSIALDYAEKELLGTTTHHVQRVALLVSRLANHMGMNKELTYALMQAALLHDCAIPEYLKDETTDEAAGIPDMNMGPHCVNGESIVSKLPFHALVPQAILYHHERADGKGSFGMTADRTPISAQLIHIADVVDVTFDLQEMSEEKYREISRWMQENSGTVVSTETAAAFMQSVDLPFLEAIAGDACTSLLKAYLPDVTTDIPAAVLKEMATVFANVTDYKSHFTWMHSLGIAQKAEEMGKYYGYSEELCDKLYIAGALHDIGKLLISNDILEKPGKLTSEEYKEIQNHAMGTWNLLRNISGIEDITSWAALHHEKLDGSGYPFGITGDKLDKNERLLACLDIYQALVEDRPYKAGFPHKDAMAILNKMGAAGQLDQSIIDDIDRHFASDNAPAAVLQTEEKTYSGEAWVCPVCGYTYEGELPDDFICPNCEQPRSVFERVS